MSESDRASPGVQSLSGLAGHVGAEAGDYEPFGTVLDALGDAACRAILREINEPMTAKEISEATGLPLSTTYRKLAFLSDTLLLSEQTEIRADGNHTCRYFPDFGAVRVVVNERRHIDVDISPRTAE